MSDNIPVHHLAHSAFWTTAVEEAHDDTFDGLHRHDFVELIWFTRADPTEAVTIDFTSYSVHDNQVVLLVPGQVFHMSLTRQRGSVMAFSQEFFSEIIGDRPMYLVGPPPFSLRADALEPLAQLLPLIVREYQHQKRGPLLKAYLTAFLFQVLESAPALPARGNDRLHALLRLLEQHYLQQREAAFYARALHVSTKHLNALVKKERGATVKELLQQRILLEAKREISFGRLTLKEIAYKLGFVDPAYFSRFFKAQTGLRAEQFRAMLPGAAH